MLLVHGLLADAEQRTDGVPGPALGAGVAHLQRLELVGEPAQRGDGAQPDRGVLLVACSATSGAAVMPVNLR